MRYQVFLLTILCLFASCVKNRVLATKDSNVNLTISTTKDKVSDIVNITAVFENRGNDIYLQKTRVMRGLRTRSLNVEIFFQDTIQMFHTSFALVNWTFPTREDYFLLASGEKYTFSFDIDFRELVSAKGMIERSDVENTYYGEYSIILIYQDFSRVKRRVFRGRIESNVLRLLYVKN